MDSKLVSKVTPGKTSVTATKLIDKPVDAPIAWLATAEANKGREVLVEQFLWHVQSVASALPEGRFAINLCDDRYLFLVALCAVIVREQTNLLPSNKNPETQQRLAERYANSYVLSDGQLSLSEHVPAFDISEVEWPSELGSCAMPMVELEHLAVISFTSGSTGEAKANLKTWRTLVESTKINSRYMQPNDQDVFYHLATVPGQHMWGLETSVLMPLLSNACLVDARPLYPQDIIDLLKRLPSPKCLITTPLHLRSLTTADGSVGDGAIPKLDNVLVATAPLESALAQTIEDKFETQLREVYGCSEVGSMAVRRAAKTEVWTQFSGLNFAHNEDGQTSVNADHLPISVVLEDRLEPVDDQSFRLQGRVSDQIKIAGKRGSLLEVNTILMKYPGVADGIVFFPPQDKAVPRLVAIVAMEQNRPLDKSDKAQLRAHFRRYLDTAFVPRPILFVDSLPREENGKLLKTKLLDFYTDLVTSG